MALILRARSGAAARSQRCQRYGGYKGYYRVAATILQNSDIGILRWDILKDLMRASDIAVRLRSESDAFRGQSPMELLGEGKARDIIAEFRRLQSRTSRDFSQAGAEYTILPVIGGIYLFGALADNPKARETSMLGTEAALDGVIVFEVLKSISQRPRPLEKDGGGHFFKGGDAFPSGHTVSIWAVASVVAHEYNKNKLVPIAAYGLATLVSASRFTARKHFASDVVAGGAMGWFIGHYVFQTHYDHAIHKRNRFTHALSHPQISPDVQPGAGTYGLSLHWNY